MNKGELLALVLKGAVNGTGKNCGESGKREHLSLPEELEAGVQEQCGAETGTEEFAVHIAQVRAAWSEGPPMIDQDMPDYSAFCSGYYQHCEYCPHYVNTGTGLFCSMWEAVYPGIVRWYPII